MNILGAYVRAYCSFPMMKADFFIPSVIMPAEPVNLEQSEVIAQKLERRLFSLHKQQSFDGFVFSELPFIHQKRLDEIRFLKNQIVLRELQDEVKSAGEMINAITENNPALKDMLHAKVDGLKKRIDEKMASDKDGP